MSSSDKPDKSSTTSRRIAPFVIAQLCLVGVAAAGISWRSWQLDQRTQLPPLRETPREIAPLYDDPTMVGDAKLASVLRKLRPRFNGTDTVIGHVDHNLRFWGAEAKFGDPHDKYVSGEQMRDLLLDHNAFTALYGAETTEKKPLLMEIEDQPGLRIREFEGKLSASHDDHTMACLAEVGTPLSYPVITPDRQATFRDVVEQSLRDFSLNQQEYEWSAVTYALFVEGVNHWVTSEGQEVSFDLIADRIMRQQMPQGVCMGNHRLHALVVLLRADDQWEGPEPMLSPKKRADIVAYLQKQTKKLVDHQHNDGFWNNQWPTATPASLKPTETIGDRLGDRIIATGHALEWWALVPQRDKMEILPPHGVLVKASQWLVRTIDELDEKQVEENNSFLSHAGRALALWRGKYPYQVDLTK